MTYYSNPINILSFLWEELKSSIREKKGYKKFIYIFWLFGPFILLIERTPADIWLSVISISFIFRVIIERDFKFLEKFGLNQFYYSGFIAYVALLYLLYHIIHLWKH